jgi:hypothetical protein
MTTYKERERLRQARVHKIKRTEWQAFKARIGCQNCAEREPVCLEFHHTGAQEKRLGGRSSFAMVLGWSRERMLTELQGCVLLCANCHRKASYQIIDVSHLPVPDYATHWIATESFAVN